MVKANTALGSITITNEAMATIVGVAATSCYGVVGMAAKNAKEGLVQLLFKDNYDKGVKVELTESGLVVDLHIIVMYEVNIPAITDSIVNKVRYKVEKLTGYKVDCVNVFVDDLKY